MKFLGKEEVLGDVLLEDRKWSWKITLKFCEQ